MIKFAVACVLAALPIACASGLKVESLCILEPSTNMCWTNKEKGLGRKITDMDSEYAINEADLKAVVKKLNECKSKPDNP